MSTYTENRKKVAAKKRAEAGAKETPTKSGKVGAKPKAEQDRKRQVSIYLVSREIEERGGDEMVKEGLYVAFKKLKKISK